MSELWASAPAISDEELERYSRHLLLPEIDLSGQAALKRSRALIVGMGGLGCPAALYLARAGVGELVIADPDRVSLSNLQRQILYEDADLGKWKVEAAAHALARANPYVRIIPVAQALTLETLLEWVARCDIVLDCSDNFPTRHAVNRAAVLAGRPLVSASAVRFDAQMAVFDLRLPESPCYHCLFPETSAPDPEERCAVTGIFAPLVGLAGAWQAAEAIKILTGAAQAAGGVLWLLDLLNSAWRRVQLRRDPLCPVCQNRKSK